MVVGVGVVGKQVEELHLSKLCVYRRVVNCDWNPCRLMPKGGPAFWAWRLRADSLKLYSKARGHGEHVTLVLQISATAVWQPGSKGRYRILITMGYPAVLWQSVGATLLGSFQFGAPAQGS